MAGAVVSVGDAQAIAQAAHELLNDEKQWQQASSAAYQRVTQFYQQKDIIQKYVSLYEEVMKHGRDRI